jgi:hypothetical protein
MNDQRGLTVDGDGVKHAQTLKNQTQSRKTHEIPNPNPKSKPITEMVLDMHRL